MSFACVKWRDVALSPTGRRLAVYSGLFRWRQIIIAVLHVGLLFTSCKCCCELGLCLASSAHMTRARYRTISGHCDNCKVADSTINIAISPNWYEPYTCQHWWPDGQQHLRWARQITSADMLYKLLLQKSTQLALNATATVEWALDTAGFQLSYCKLSVVMWHIWWNQSILSWKKNLQARQVIKNKTSSPCYLIS